MINNFELINNFLATSQQKVDFFWKSVQGDFKDEVIIILLFMLPLIPFILGAAILYERMRNYHDLYFIGMDRLFGSLPYIFSIILNISLWVSYFLLSVAVIISCYKLLAQKSELFFTRNSTELAQNFSPVETVVFSSLRISQELDKYSKAKMPSDLGLGGDIDWIEGCFYKVLTGKRPTGSYSGPVVRTNSLFADLKEEKDVVNRLELYSWYDKKDAERDQIIPKIFKLKDFIFKVGFGNDYALGAQVYKSIAQTFLAAHLKQKKKFREYLEYTLDIYEEYSKTSAPLKGLPHYTVKFTPKILITVIMALFFIFLAIIFIFFMPKWIVYFVSYKFNKNLDITIVKDVVNLSITLITVFGFIFMKIWKG